MNVFNRVVMILNILVVLVLLTIALAVPVESLTAVQAVVNNGLLTLGRVRPEFVLPFRALLILCMVLLDLLLIGLLILELRGPARRSIRVQKVGGGVAAITTEALVEHLQYNLDQLEDVISVKVKAAPRGGSVDLGLDVRTGPNVNVPEKAGEVLKVARQVVEEKLGLKLAGQPRVTIHTVPHPSGVVRPMPGSLASLPVTPSAPPPAESESPFRRDEDK